MKILLTDATSLTSSQVSTILNRKHHQVHVLSPPGLLSIKTLTSHTITQHPVPPFSSSPYTWLAATLSVLRAQKFDILLCTQEQVAIISAEQEAVAATGVKFAVPEFESLRRVMDKVSACQTLADAGLPQPESVALSSTMDALPRCEALLPAYIKTPIGTASTGVRRVSNREELAAIIMDDIGQGYFDDGGELLVQKEIQGSLLMVCGVFDRGKLRAWHACVRVREGSGGGASKKVSLPLRKVGEHLQGLGYLLNWHGALSLDAILEGGRAWYVDVNPRIVEPVNGLLAGVDLVQELLDVSSGKEVEDGRQPRHGIEGVETHQLVLAMMKAAEEGRLVLLIEVFKALMGFDQYAGSVEELTPLEGNFVWGLLGLVGLFLLLFVGGPWAVAKLRGDTVVNYAVGEKGWREILERVDGREKTLES